MLVPKVIGYDGELGNYISGRGGEGSTAEEAARLLIEEIPGFADKGMHRLPACTCSYCRSSGGAGWKEGGYYRGNEQGVPLYYAAASSPQSEPLVNPRDHDRRYLAQNGGCVYIDLGHLELCLPEVRSAWDHVACWRAMLKIALGALKAANGKLGSAERIRVLVNNSDGQGHSYGSHMNFLISRRCWRDIFDRRMRHLLYLASYQASSIIFAGQGKVGSENGAPWVDYQLSQRADFLVKVVGPETTYSRPLINTRDEPLCGPLRLGGGEDVKQEQARLHVICYDANLCQVATLLKAGVMQIILTMIEGDIVDMDLILDDPVDALHTWSRDPSLQAEAVTCSGNRLTALGLQKRFLARAKEFVAGGHCRGIVPGADEIVLLWEETLVRLEERDLPALAGRLDWALKLMILREVMAEQRGLDWRDPALKNLDHLYSSLDPEEGLFWAYEREGYTDKVVDDGEVEKFMVEPPEDTRAWGRTMLLRAAGAHRVEEVNWDRVKVRLGEGERARHAVAYFADPLSFTRAESAGSSVSSR